MKAHRVCGWKLLGAALLVLAAGGGLVATRSEPVRVLYVKGLFHLTLELDRGIDRLAEVTGRRAEVVSVYYEWDYHEEVPRLIGFPGGSAELADYDAVILVNVDVAALGDEGVHALAEYVEDGGGLLVIGGLFAYGRGGYEGSALEEVLPVSTVRFHDLAKCSDGRMMPASVAHPLLDGLDMTEPPVCPYMHEVRPKPAGKVLMECDSKPLLVLGEYGKGTVAAFMGTALGEPPPNRMAFWHWSAWPDLVARLLDWLERGRSICTANQP